MIVLQGSDLRLAHFKAFCGGGVREPLILDQPIDLYREPPLGIELRCVWHSQVSEDVPGAWLDSRAVCHSGPRSQCGQLQSLRDPIHVHLGGLDPVGRLLLKAMQNVKGFADGCFPRC
jgi:hypothetical protein